METSNKAIGTSYEERFAVALWEQGFWVHLLKQTEAGQPADVIACRGGKTFLIDCKMCSDGTFPLSRIEENQELAMKAFMEAGNEEPWFALEVDGETYMLPFHFMLSQMTWAGKRSLSRKVITERGMKLGEWIGAWFTT